MLAVGHGTRDGYLKRRCRCADCRGWNTQRKRAYRARYPERAKAYDRAWYRSHPREAHRDKVLRRYGVTVERYEALVAEQRGRCAICGKPPPEGKVLQVDHDHSCCPGQRSCGSCVRGLLCRACNTAIATLGDTADGLQRALAYLRVAD